MNAIGNNFNMTNYNTTGSTPHVEDFTTNATNSTIYEPSKTSDSHIEECKGIYVNFCFNGGKCQWLTGINKASCLCVNDYGGERCGVKNLSTTEARSVFGDYWEVFVIGTIFGIVILLTLIFAIIYIFRKRKQAQATRRQYRQHAEAVIQNSYPINGRAQAPDANQNTTADKYAPLATGESEAFLGTVVTNENETLETAFAEQRNNSTPLFKLQDPPPGRKSSGQSNQSSSRESRV